MNKYNSESSFTASSTASSNIVTRQIHQNYIKILEIFEKLGFYVTRRTWNRKRNKECVGFKNPRTRRNCFITHNSGSWLILEFTPNFNEFRELEFFKSLHPEVVESLNNKEKFLLGLIAYLDYLGLANIPIEACNSTLKINLNWGGKN